MRCAVAPVPEEENAYWSGFARSKAMNSFAFAAGKEGFVTRAKGVSAIRLTGAKSFIGSYGTFCRLGMMESGPLEAASSAAISVACPGGQGTTTLTDLLG